MVARAAKAGLGTIALTDHDSLAGVPEALAAGARMGVRVLGGCEFSVAAPWGEMHVLGLFLPTGDAELEAFLTSTRADRHRRAVAMVDRLHELGLAVAMEDVLACAAGGAIGRPHVARALLMRGHVASVDEAFDRYLARGRPAFEAKRLPTFSAVVALVHRAGGIVSAAHLKDRGTKSYLERLKREGLDAVETRHPRHDPDLRARLTDHALALGLLRTGGSDWHGDDGIGPGRSAVGSQAVPGEWLGPLEERREHWRRSGRSTET